MFGEYINEKKFYGIGFEDSTLKTFIKVQSVFCWLTLYNNSLMIEKYVMLYIQPFSQNYGLASYTTHVVCVNFIHEWLDLLFNVDSKRKIFFEKLFHCRLRYSQSICKKSAKRKPAKKYFLRNISCYKKKYK